MNSDLNPKTIISSKGSKKKLSTTCFIFLGISILSFILYSINFRMDLNNKLYWLTHSKDPLFGIVVDTGFQFGDFLFYGLIYTFTLGVSFINLILELIWIVLPIATLVLFFKTRDSEITVSNTMVHGKHSFGKNANLPIVNITSVGVGKFNSVIIATGSEKYKFWFLENNDDIVAVISDKIKIKNTPTNGNLSSATEIQKYKELLDSGIITKEEFEAKKKQLLEL